MIIAVRGEIKLAEMFSDANSSGLHIHIGGGVGTGFQVWVSVWEVVFGFGVEPDGILGLGFGSRVGNGEI